MPFQLGYRPRNIRKNQKAPTLVGAFKDFNLNLLVLWTDQSRRPSAIDAPCHHGFGRYCHIQAKYSTVFATQKIFLAPISCRLVISRSNESSSNCGNSSASHQSLEHRLAVKLLSSITSNVTDRLQKPHVVSFTHAAQWPAKPGLRTRKSFQPPIQPGNRACAVVVAK